MTADYWLNPTIYPGCELLAVEFVGGQKCGERAGLPVDAHRWNVPVRELVSGLALTVGPQLPGELPMPGSGAIVVLGEYRFAGGLRVVLRNSSSRPIKLDQLWERMATSYPALFASGTVFEWQGELG